MALAFSRMCRRVRAHAAVIILTARGGEATALRAYGMGAGRLRREAFLGAQLLARVESRVRRSVDRSTTFARLNWVEAPSILRAGKSSGRAPRASNYRRRSCVPGSWWQSERAVSRESY